MTFTKIRAIPTPVPCWRITACGPTTRPAAEIHTRCTSQPAGGTARLSICLPL